MTNQKTLAKPPWTGIGTSSTSIPLLECEKFCLVTMCTKKIREMTPCFHTNSTVMFMMKRVQAIITRLIVSTTASHFIARSYAQGKVTGHYRAKIN